MPTAYSYLRFSSPEQAKGDSIRRQTQARDKWLAEHPGVTLDTSLKMTDAGRSAFKRTNFETYCILQFVELVKAGKIPQGSYLLLENLDRLSREEAGEATELLLSIVNRGVIVVQLMPTVLEFRKPVNTMSLMFAIVELSRGHSESEAKSKRGLEVWGCKQQTAGTKLVTKTVPGWIEVQDGKLILNEAKAKVVRRMFKMAIDGHGHQAIAVTLTKESVPVMRRATLKGRPVKWSCTTVRHILRSRATVGEYVANTGTKGRKPLGEPVLGYFPAAITEDTYNAAQAAMKSQVNFGRGRRGKHVNLFSGMMIDAHNGGTIGYRHQARTVAVIASIDALQGRAKWVSFPAIQFEDAILSQLREVRVQDVQGDDDDATNKAEAIRGRRDAVDTLILAWTAKMDDVSIIDRVAAKLTELTKKRKVLDAEYKAAAEEAASPIGDALADIRTLADVLKTDNSDENRTRVRAAIRRVVEEIRVTISPFKRVNKVIWADVRFVGGAVRSYGISFFAPSGRGPKRTPGCWYAHSGKLPDLDPEAENYPERCREWAQSGESTYGEVK